LALPVYFGNGAIFSELSDQQKDIGTEVKTSFKIDIIKNKSEGVLLFKLKSHVKSDDQHNMDTLTIKTDKNRATRVYMLVAWEMKDAKPFAYVALVEHIKGFIWNVDSLRKLYHENHDQLKEYTDTISDTWLVDNNMILKTTFSARDSKGILELSVSISEEEEEEEEEEEIDYAMRPFCIHPER
jgi:hypothetical protein